MATRTPGRIVLPTSPKDSLNLFQAILNKHYSLGGNSPLQQMDGIDLYAINGRIAPTLELHNAAENAKRQMEESYRQRDLQLAPIMDALKKSVALLKAAYATNPKKLGEWGINVDDTKQDKAPKASKDPEKS